jgi:hypothetical protein
MTTNEKWFHERNDRFLNDETVNVYFEDILAMTDTEFRSWLKCVCDKLLENWDKYNIPPVVGLNETDIIEQFNKMSGFDSEKLWDVDELTGERNIIRNKYYYGSAVNQWFPTMFKASIKTTTKGKGQNIYEFFADPSKFESMYKSAIRNFKHDSFYHYSLSIIKNDKSRSQSEQPLVDNPVEWVKQFEQHYRGKVDFDYWINPIKGKKEYSGFKKELFDVKFLWLTKDELISFYNVSSNPRIAFNPAIDRLTQKDWESDLFEIRFYKKKQRLFPIGMKCFRIAYGKQIAVNFPPLVAKALYEKYTEHLDHSQPIVVYDPSAGWAGRILGAMAVKDDRHIHYIGTDPNTDHDTTGKRTKYHEVADFFNNRTTRSSPFTHRNSYEIYQSGSEDMKYEVNFEKYYGRIDLVFTSPPYFTKEIYSNDPEQSCHKFGDSYESWRDGFLRPTLETAVEYLDHDRYLLWNIADAEFDGVRLPLEQDSKDILQSLGMEYVGIVKLALASMPGANRLKETEDYDVFEENTLDGVVTHKQKVFTTYTKNSCKLNGRMVKYEPIFVFRKP